MRTLMMKTKCDINSVRVTIGDPRATPGDNHDSSLQLRLIKNIPDNVSSDVVLTRFKQTIDVTAYGKKGARMEFDFNELGAGKLIK